MKANRWLPLLVAVWGTVTTLTGVIHDFSGLIAIRFFLGLCEGGLLPGIVCGSVSIFLHYGAHHSPDAVSQYFIQAARAAATVRLVGRLSQMAKRAQ